MFSRVKRQINRRAPASILIHEEKIIIIIILFSYQLGDTLDFFFFFTINYTGEFVKSNINPNVFSLLMKC